VRLSLRSLLSSALFLSLTAGIASAQTAVGAGPNNPATPVKDSSMLKPPAGAKVAIVEWEDLECPACMHAFPFVHQAVAHYHIPLVEYDFLIPGHIWSTQAALYARYLHDKVSPDLATEYRREVFASQYRIASQDDLQTFTKQFFAAHGKQMPFVVDPTGELKHEIEADRDLGLKMGLIHTPTIFVVTPHHYIEVANVDDLYSAIDQAQAMESTPAAAHHTTASAAHH
jgi:protein-disulfide isomerase